MFLCTSAVRCVLVNRATTAAMIGKSLVTAPPMARTSLRASAQLWAVTIYDRVSGARTAWVFPETGSEVVITAARTMLGLLRRTLIRHSVSFHPGRAQFDLVREFSQCSDRPESQVGV